MKQLFVGKLVNYGASKSNAAARTALGADDLADGAVGIFALCNDGKTRLVVTAAGADGASTVTVASLTGTDATYSGKKIQFARGTSTAAFVSPQFEWSTTVGGSVVTKGKENELPMAQMSFVGYDPIVGAGSFNLPTAVLGDSVTVAGSVKILGYPDAKLFSYSYGPIFGLSTYDAIKGVVDKINTGALLQADVVGAVGTETAPVQVGGSYIFVKGSNVINNASASATTVVAGDYLRIHNLQPLVPPSTGINTATVAPTPAASALYKVLSVGTNGVSITLDRPYSGENQTLTVAQFNVRVTRVTVLPTALGIRLIGLANTPVSMPILTNVTFDINTTENLENATITRERGAQTGSGTANHLLNLQQLFNSEKGYLYSGNNVLNMLKPAPNYVDSSVNTYDLYMTNARHIVTETSDTVTLPNKEVSEIIVAFPTSATSAGGNQNDYDILIKLLSAYQGDISLSA